MQLNFERIKRLKPTYSTFLSRLESLFAHMDRNYREAAAHYGFNCTGCEDNCCYTRFFHHTLLEYVYLWEGFDALPAETRLQIKSRAKHVRRETEAAGTPAPRLLCPLNFDGLCRLYAFRPMICRLHGIPHELRPPGQGSVLQPGCKAFAEQFAEQSYFKFDRTPLFIEMAQLEQALKRETGLTNKIKLTVAQMVDTF